MGTHNICFHVEIRKIIRTPQSLYNTIVGIQSINRVS